ncbi:MULTISPECIES: hypothetical protein [Exiguobacterium]|uniref:Carrier domain-containing protein n=1 Tax=Exiguobacterium antarcticum TaxID=132920 RepID=A0ABT6R1X7_9BACL|nr:MULTISPECIES: hypothetical protein [Exiguobacterium]MCT4780448.1 hypothetical protein [Exiguobacterium soli]MDI3234284.1 hypothetical protein [Exiguobacterium antarcticum]
MKRVLNHLAFRQLVRDHLDVVLPEELTGQERLRDELQLDSMRLLQLLVHLELELDLILADEKLGQLPQMTVDQFLQSLQKKEVLR